MFNGLTKLQRLELGKNNLELEGLPDGVFNDLIGLEELRLGDNHLEESDLNDPVFDSLDSEVIDLRRHDDSGSTKTG